jgi:hypothetical protein
VRSAIRFDGYAWSACRAVDEQLDIGLGHSLERLTTKISNGYRLKKRLIED